MVSFAQLRNLDTSKLTTAADTAATVGKDMEGHAGDVADAAKQGNGTGFWGGADADAQNALLNTFPPPLNAAGSVFKSSAGTIDTLVDELDAAKEEIENAISSYPRLIVSDDGSVIWPPTNSAEDAQQLQAQARDLAAKLQAAVEKANAADETASSQLATNDLGAGNGPIQVRLPDGSVYLATGDDDNDVDVTTDADGNVVVNVDGKEFKYDPGTNLTLNTGGGEDNVDINKSVNSGVTLSTGDGKDTVTDHESQGQRTFVTGEGEDTVATTGDNRNIFTEGGNDTVRAIGNGNNLASGAGDDQIETTGGKVFAGDGNDTVRAGDHDSPFFRDRPENATDIYGGAGNDKITGSNQNDTIVGGGGNDEIKGRGGNDIISGNGGDDNISGGDGDDQVEAGSGDDEVSAGDGNDRVSSGDGDDQVYGNGGNDSIAGGRGNDYIDGQDGDDRIAGEEGKDTLYGLDGNDNITGGDDQDYLEGGRGDDRIDGQAGDDVLSGGRDNDNIIGGDGDDVMYAGEGQDSLDGGAGADKNFVQDGDAVTEDKADLVQKVDIVNNDFIQVEGSDEFKDRIRADLDMMSSSPTGRHMIEDLADKVSDTHDDWLPGEAEVVIHEFDEENGTASRDGLWFSDSNVNINPDFHLDTPNDNDGRPSTVLYHELSHAGDQLGDGVDRTAHTDPNDPDSMIDDDGNRVGVPNGERAAVGLPIDHDGDPNTPLRVDPNQPYERTENGLREEMGLPLRPTYGSPTPP